MDQFTVSLAETLKQTTVPDSNVIKAATDRLKKEFYQNPASLPALVHLLIAGDATVQQLAAVEARKQVISGWEKVDASTQENIRAEVLKAVFEQPETKIRHAAAKLVASIVDSSEDFNQWPQILPTLIERVNDTNTKESAVYALYCILETQNYILQPHVSDFLSLFSGLLNDQSISIRVNAVKALDHIGSFLDETSMQQEGNDQGIIAAEATRFAETIPAMVKVLGEVIATGDDEKVKEVFNTFNNFLFVDSKLLGDHLPQLVELILQVASNKDLDDEIRSFGLQWLITCVSLKRSRIVKFGPTVTTVALQIASEEIDVEEELETEQDANENEESNSNSLAIRLIAMLSAELPPAQACAVILEKSQQLINSTNPFEKRAALLSIGVGSVGAPDYFNTYVKQVEAVVVRGLSDSEPIVSLSALRCLAQLTGELSGNIAEYHRELLPLVMNVIDNTKNAKAYKYACYGLDGLVEFMPHEGISECLEPLVHKLFQMLNQANTSTLRSAIVSAIGSAAFAAGKLFTPFFEGAIQALEPFIRDMNNASDEDEIEMKASTFENISTMARAVGSESFSQYANPLLEAAYTALASEHSRIRESGFAFITNMSKVYGAKFASFLDQLVPAILKCLEQEEFTLGDLTEEVGQEDEDEDDDKFNVNTGITIEKEIASVALSDLAMGTGAAFAPYVEQSIQTLSEQIEESYGMREACANALWSIGYAMFKAEKGGDFKAPKGVPQSSYVSNEILAILHNVRDTSLSSLEEEFDLTMVACILENFCSGLQNMGAIAITSGPSDTGALEKLCIQLMLILKKEHPCQVEDEGEDIQDDEDTSETESFIFDSALEVLVSLSLALANDFPKILDSFKDIIVSNTTAKSLRKRVAATGALAEFTIGLKSSIAAYYQEFFNVFIESLAKDESLEVRSNAVYGIGRLIEETPADLSSAYQQVLELIFALISKTESAETQEIESQDSINRTFANSLGAIARMALKNRAAVPLDHVLPPVLQHLPLKSDFDENIPVFMLIIALYEEDSQLIASQTQTVVDIFAKVFTKEKERLKLVDEMTVGKEENLDVLKQFPKPELQEKVIALLRHLDGKYNGVVSSNAVLKEVIN